MTKYKVLILNEEGGYSIIGEGIETHGPQQAMRVVTKGMNPDVLVGGIKLVAVPESTWTEEPVGIVVPPPRIVIGGDAPQQTTIEGAVAEVEAEPEPEVES